MTIIRSRHQLRIPVELALYDAADDVIEYRLRINNRTGEYRADLQEVINHIQSAAVAARKNDNAGILNDLIRASKDTEDVDIIHDIYRLIYHLGFECPAHGLKTFIHTTGGMHFDGGEVWDDLTDHVCCSFCGEEIPQSKLVITLSKSEELPI